MNRFRKLALATATAGMVALAPLAALAEDKDIGQQLNEARQEGAVWTAIAINRHLSPFSIDVDVESGTAILTGTVESAVDQDLAEQVALGIEGIERVDNQLSIDASGSGGGESRSELAQRFEDATLTATIKSKLLWNRNTSGLDINVTTENGEVSLSGVAESAESRELAERLADNTEGVRKVHNRIEVSSDQGTADKARQTAQSLGDGVSDAWITSKVKSSLLLNSNLKGMDIHVETRNGEVTLSGVVRNSTEKDLAEEIASNIRGVAGVSASGLQVQG
ncbi:MAG: BON domain-containing protein [Bacteroidales bacterium]|nr:BON domain-containing protein [Bacteroidales bacterium]